METYIAVHKTFNKENAAAKREVVLYVSNGEEVFKIMPKDREEWIKSRPEGQVLRFTSVHTADDLLNDLTSRGHKIVYANWHSTGIAKNLTAEEIVLAFAKLPDSAFREFVPRPDLNELRFRVSQRLALLEYRKAVILKLKGAGRLFGALTEEDLPDNVKDLIKQAEKETNVTVPVTSKGKTKNVKIDTAIAEMAENIRECVLFNSAAHIEGSWNTAATVVAFSGGIDRFDTVASLWHYCGEHVVDGQAPKRKKGSAVTWSPKLRTALWQMSDSLIKNRNNPWRAFYEDELAKELAVHEVKHPGCKTPQGHCGARSRRKLRKEILKRFFLACNGREYRVSDGHVSIENQVSDAVA